MDKEKIKKDLLLKLKKAHRFWSYDSASISLNNISDNILIEMVLMYLDIEDIDELFKIFSYQQIKKCWIESLIPQGEYIYSLNKFIAWYYFNMKRPGAYVKSMATHQLNSISL